MKYDFKAIKRDTPIEKVMVWLGLKFHKEGKGWRANCPVCDAAERSLSIDIEKNTFYCHSLERGGSILDLVIHVKGVDLKAAAEFILSHSTKKETVPPKNEERTKPTPGDFQPLSHLIFDHELVRTIGISAEDAQKLGIGYAARGLLKGHVCIPVRDATGFLNGYVGIKEGKTPKEWHYPASNVVPLKKKRA